MMKPTLFWRLLRAFDSVLRVIFTGPQALAFVPALMLGGFWYGGEALLLLAALILPAVLGMVTLFSQENRHAAEDRNATIDRVTGLPDLAHVTGFLDQALTGPATNDLRTAALMIEIDDADTLRQQIGDAAMDRLTRQTADRIGEELRDGDLIGCGRRKAQIAVALAPARRIDLEGMIQIAARAQRALSDPFVLDARKLHLTVSVGFCLPRRPEEHRGGACLAAAEAALAEAQRCGPGAIRSFVPTMAAPVATTAGMAEELAAALESGQIGPWFQPQVSTDTGAISGLEALARWEHPSHGLILPKDFLPVAEAAGLHHRLTDVMLSGALAALAEYQESGLRIPAVAVNFGATDLADPMLPEKIQWLLDQHGLTADRLAVEVLETVIAETGDEATARTLARLAAMGCRIDLDDFGTGHAAIGNIRRFSVSRIKIDRSFVTRIDVDPEQQNMLAAILGMAERLELETLAEGVETVGEHALLAQLGCAHVQGYSIARPMPPGQLPDWVATYQNSRPGPVWPQQQTG